LPRLRLSIGRLIDGQFVPHLSWKHHAPGFVNWHQHVIQYHIFIPLPLWNGNRKNIPFLFGPPDFADKALENPPCEPEDGGEKSRSPPHPGLPPRRGFFLEWRFSVGDANLWLVFGEDGAIKTLRFPRQARIEDGNRALRWWRRRHKLRTMTDGIMAMVSGGTRLAVALDRRVRGRVGEERVAFLGLFHGCMYRTCWR